MAHRPTIWVALRAKLGRFPTNAELKEEVKRIIAEGKGRNKIMKSKHTYNLHKFDTVRDRFGEIVNSFADMDIAVDRANLLHESSGEAFAVVRDSLVAVYTVRSSASYL